MWLHIGQGFAAIRNAPDAPIDNMIILAMQVSTFAAQDLLWGGAMTKYPDLKIAWSEAGIGWIPCYLDRCDRYYTNQRWPGHDFGGKLPSEIFREHSLACYVTDPTALKVRHDIGVANIAWECDFPHSDTIWPNAPEFVLDEMNGAGAPDHEINMITYENTCRFFGWDAFRTSPARMRPWARCVPCHPTSTPRCAPSTSGATCTRSPVAPTASGWGPRRPPGRTSRGCARSGAVPSSSWASAGTDALGEGFDAGMWVGEDVDLCWRLVAAGRRVHYEPADRAAHEHRVRLGDWLRRKAVYGTGAHPLAERHPEFVAPAVFAPWSTAFAAALLAGRRWSVPAGAAVLGVVTVRIARKLDGTRHPAPGTRHPAPGTRHPAPGTRTGSPPTAPSPPWHRPPRC
ncbi:hypothetical protein ABZ490_50375 [Streptomyces sp. NPDC005811]|uniref:hypothetical protein n=1 Tax=Streptomyces sp. NPDC005811 TaxID=3154565 RepID=UPI0033E91210